MPKQQSNALDMLVVGAGGMGRAWLDTLVADSRWHITAVVDVDEEVLGKVSETFDISPRACFQDLEQALDATKPDAVLIASPPEAHHDAILMALACGFPVFTEKPLAATLSEGVDILK